jgi:hypothetical protein
VRRVRQRALVPILRTVQNCACYSRQRGVLSNLPLVEIFVAEFRRSPSRRCRGGLSHHVLTRAARDTAKLSSNMRK